MIAVAHSRINAIRAQFGESSPIRRSSIHPGQDPMEPQLVVTPRVSLRHQLFGAWCAPIFTVLTLIGFIWLAHFYLPAHADLTPDQTARWFLVDHRFGILLGMSIWILSICVFSYWVAQLGVMLAKMEGPMPIMALTQVISGAAIVVIVIIDASLWMSAAYRLGTNSQIVLALSDAAWLSLLTAWPTLTVEMLATAAITLRDRRASPTFPRWLSWASVVGAVLLFTAAGPAFTHFGAWSYHGFLGYYLPFIIWGAWVDTHAFYMRRSIRHQIKLLQVADASSLPKARSAEVV
jgi:hypothetical protein